MWKCFRFFDTIVKPFSIAVTAINASKVRRRYDLAYRLSNS